ncbi:MAG: hypothetical protein ABI221_00305 [Candidatus Saccharimonadales bacterium]
MDKKIAQHHFNQSVVNTAVVKRGRGLGRASRPGLVITGLAVFAVIALSLLAKPVLAASQSYLTTDKTITKGMAVAVVSSSSANKNLVTVQKSSVNRANKTLGVVVALDDSLVTSVDGGATQAQKLYVADSGQATVFVTDINGAVHKGDLLAPSPLEGVLMKANTGTPGVLGLALADMSSQTMQTVSLSGDGPIHSAKVALVGINMDIRFASSSSGVQQSLLVRLGQGLVHKEVSQVQTFIALSVLILLIVVEGSIVYAAVSSSITSLGRNPLAKRTIYRGLFQASGLVFMVLVVGLAAIYMVMRI